MAGDWSVGRAAGDGPGTGLIQRRGAMTQHCRRRAGRLAEEEEEEEEECCFFSWEKTIDKNNDCSKTVTKTALMTEVKLQRKHKYTTRLIGYQ